MPFQTSSTDEIVDDSRSSHTTCPPEDDRSGDWRGSEIEAVRDESDHPIDAPMMNQDITPAESRSQNAAEPPESDELQNPKKMEPEEDSSPSMDMTSSDMMSPASLDDKQDEALQSPLANANAGNSPSMSQEFSNVRLLPSSPSSYLRPGSKFHGTQQSERQVYDVQVEIKHVDMRESFLCGYLRIQGLTEDHPTLTTYFEGEIIGSKYSFLTQHEDWGSTDKVDLQHWAKFSAFRPYQKSARKGNLHIPNLTQRENIFMRWKEHFLVPDHRVRTISGASFEGFYYICFNQIQGTVSGIYFHAKSEKFQQLELKHVEDRGCFAAMEFR